MPGPPVIPAASSGATATSGAATMNPQTSSTALTPRQELVEAVRHWVHFDNLAETLQKQVTNTRTMRSNYEDTILNMLEVQGMKNAVLQINGATLQRSTKTKPGDLSWTFLEEQLHAFFKSKGKPDDTGIILEFLQTHRGNKTTDYLKKTVNTDTLKR